MPEGGPVVDAPSEHLWYILDGHDPKPVDMRTWVEEGRLPHVADETLPSGVRVSTMFLGQLGGHDSDGRPLLFETMVFGGEHDYYEERYPTWDAAEEGHKRVVVMVTGGE